MTTVRIKCPDWIDYIFVLPVLLFRRIKYGFSFRRIPLGEGRFALVDQQDYYRLNHFNWITKGSDELCYAIKLIGDSRHPKFLSMHREIMDSPKGLLVDHRNLNRLDNRRENLRKATHSQNMQNRVKIRVKTTSQFIGVHWLLGERKWRAQISYQKKHIYLGRFHNEIDAARAYDRAAIKYHGEFARLNFPQEDYAREINTEKQNKEKS